MRDALLIRQNPAPVQPPIVSVDLAPLSPLQAAKLYALLQASGDRDLDDIYFSLTDAIADIKQQVGEFIAEQSGEDGDSEDVNSNSLHFRKATNND